MNMFKGNITRSLRQAARSPTTTPILCRARMPPTTVLKWSRTSGFSPTVRSLHSSSRRSSYGQPNYSRFGGGSSKGWKLAERFGDPKVQKVTFVVLTVAGVYYVYHLERVPESGRWRFIDVSRETEKAAGDESFRDTMKAYQYSILPPNHPISRRVQNVAARLLSAGGLGHLKGSPTIPEPLISSFGEDSWDAGSRSEPSSDIAEEWEVFVVNDPKTPNAFVLPNGKIFVFTGLLPICGGDDGLAAVLGHEIAHRAARHHGERLSSAKVLFFLVGLLEFLGLDVGVSRLGLSVLMTLPNSRTQEAEADSIGLKLMSRACFDPTEASQMWVRMEESEKTESSTSFLGSLFGGSLRNVDFTSTHPASVKRIKAMEQQLPDALALRAATSACAHTGEQFDDFRAKLQDSFSGFGPGRF